MKPEPVPDLDWDPKRARDGRRQVADRVDGWVRKTLT
jgi:hypothetical protein